MSAGDSRPVEPPVVQAESDVPVERRNSAAFGVITFILAILAFLMEPAVNGLVNTAAFLDQASTISATLGGIQIVATLGVLVLALVAAIQRRGTGWAVSAICIILAGNIYVLAGIGYLFGVLFQAIFGTPEFLH